MDRFRIAFVATPNNNLSHFLIRFADPWLNVFDNRLSLDLRLHLFAKPVHVSNRQPSLAVRVGPTQEQAAVCQVARLDDASKLVAQRIELFGANVAQYDASELEKLDSKWKLGLLFQTVIVQSFHRPRINLNQIQNLEQRNHAAATHISARICTLKPDTLPMGSNLRAYLFPRQESVDLVNHLQVFGMPAEIKSLKGLFVPKQPHFGDCKDLLIFMNQPRAAEHRCGVETSKELRQ